MQVFEGGLRFFPAAMQQDVRNKISFISLVAFQSPSIALCVLSHGLARVHVRVRADVQGILLVIMLATAVSIILALVSMVLAIMLVHNAWDLSRDRWKALAETGQTGYRQVSARAIFRPAVRRCRRMTLDRGRAATHVVGLCRASDLRHGGHN